MQNLVSIRNIKLLLVTCLLFVLYLNFHSINAFASACGRGGFMGNWNATSYTSCGDSMWLNLNTPSPLGRDTTSPGNPYLYYGGTDVDFTMGYDSGASAPSGYNVYSWVQIPDINSLLPDANITSSTGGDNMAEIPYCSTVVPPYPPTSFPPSPFGNPNFLSTPYSAVACNGDKLCSGAWTPPAWDPSPENCPATSPALSDPVPQGRLSDSHGHIFLWYQNNSSSSSAPNHNYDLQIHLPTTPSDVNAEFCFRLHVSLGQDPFNTNPIILSRNDLPDIYGMYDGTPGDSGDMCIKIAPPAAHSNASCSYIGIPDINPLTQILTNIVGINGDGSVAGTIMPSGLTNLPSNRPSDKITTNYNGDGT